MLSKKDKRMLFGKSMSLTALALLIILCIVICSIISLGWFANNKRISALGMYASAEEFDAKATYTAYVYNAKTNELIVNSSEFSAPNFVNLVGSDGFLKLMPFDMIFKMRNRYTPAIVKIHLYDIKEEFRTAGTVNVKLDRGISGLENANTLGNYASSTMRFSLVTGTYHNNSVLSGISNKNIVEPSINAELPGIFESVYRYVNSYPLPTTSFTSYSGSGPYSYSEQSSITLSVSYTTANMVNNELDLFMYINYDEDIIFQKLPTGIGYDTTVIGQIDEILNNIEKLTISFSN